MPGRWAIRWSVCRDQASLRVEVRGHHGRTHLRDVVRQRALHRRRADGQVVAVGAVQQTVQLQGHRALRQQVEQLLALLGRAAGTTGCPARVPVDQKPGASLYRKTAFAPASFAALTCASTWSIATHRISATLSLAPVSSAAVPSPPLTSGELLVPDVHGPARAPARRRQPEAAARAADVDGQLRLREVPALHDLEGAVGNLSEVLHVDAVRRPGRCRPSRTPRPGRRPCGARRCRCSARRRAAASSPSPCAPCGRRR